jgi:predicted RND superfamily exporter protein
LLATFAVAVFSLAQMVDLVTGQPKLTLDPSIDGILPKNDEGRSYFEELKQRFSAGEVVLLALVADDVLAFENLSSLKLTSEELEMLEQVDPLSSLSLSRNIRNEAGSLVTNPF